MGAPLDSALGGSPTETRLALGTPVTFTSVLERQEVQVRTGSLHCDGDYEKQWRPAARSGEGIVIGYRTLANGYTRYLREEGHEWRQTGTVRCVLVATSLYRKPACIPLDAVRAVASSSQETPNG